jgi:hypothetical protein
VLGQLAELGVIAVKRGDPWTGGLLWGASERLAAEVGPSVFDASLDELLAALGERSEVFELAAAEGRALSLDEVLALVEIRVP